MDVLTQEQLAIYEKVEPPVVEKSSFLYSFTLLPKEERVAINSVYAFCSYIDDIVDSSPNLNKKSILKKLDRLSWWENEIENIYAERLKSPVMLPLVAVINRFELPKQFFLTLIDGVRRDLIQYRYSNFEELKEYCYSVASVVGLISIEIFGHKYEETKNYAINLGYALQLTNIIRDIKFDKDRGYIYLPLDELERFNYSEKELIEEVYNENFVNLMSFQADRAREYYHKARMNLKPDERTTIVAAEIMDSIYFRLLEKIELQDFNVYQPRKIRVSTAHKFLMTLKHWLSVNMFIRRIKKH
ncbi:MAG: squalene/phytoene synthase family protein [Candidatus Kapaibacterium sp.]|jgi:phytoene synthase|nr:squalene/phytoene synthase family protein [Candidatus Kapabacteria bacterium]